MRSFIATPLSDETKAALLPLQRVLRVGRPVPPDNMHLTLVFLDDQPEEVLETLHEELLTLTAPPFCVTFSGIEHLGRAIAVGSGRVHFTHNATPENPDSHAASRDRPAPPSFPSACYYRSCETRA